MSRPNIEATEQIIAEHEREGHKTTIVEISVVRAILDYVADLEEQGRQRGPWLQDASIYDPRHASEEDQ